MPSTNCLTKSRVLIVDDAVVVRRLVANALAEDPALEVVGTAANGRIALDKIERVRPDVVTLDLEMPEMDGLETLAAIRQRYPRLPVIMLSRFTQRGAAAALDALALGACDYVGIPETAANPEAALDCIREQLIPRLKTFATRNREVETVPPTSFSRNRLPPELSARPGGRIEAIAIGVSTGGPAALTTLLAAFPADLTVPTLIVQHMPPMFTRLLAERLAVQTVLRVREGEDAQAVRPEDTWLAPGNQHMEVVRDGAGVRLRLQQDPQENSCRPSVDVLFRSAAAVYGSGVLAVVLTGMGQDGLRGCEAIRAAGGQVLVQDEATSVVWGMPGAVARAGLADKILPLEQIGPEVVRRVRLGRSASYAGLLRRAVPVGDKSGQFPSPVARKEPPCL